MVDDYSEREMMIVSVSRLLEDNRTVFTGTGMPVLASKLAQETHSPGLGVIYEAGGFCPERAKTIPISVGDSISTHRAVMAASLEYVMSFIQAGYGYYALLGAAQIDQYGNINTSTIGPHDKPKVRLPGSGGANDFASLCWKTIILMQQDKQRFVEELDFRTTPGYIEGPDSREEIPLPSGTGPWRVVTQLGVYGFDEESKKMKLVRTQPGVSVEEIKDNTGFELKVPDDLELEPEPTEEELNTLRKLDPYGLVIK